MTRLVAGELIKVRTTRTAVGFAIAALLLALATTLAVALAGDPNTIREKRDALGFGSVIAAVLLVYGVVGATGEFRHRTLAPAVLIAPDRFRLVIARMVAYGVTAGLVALAVGAVSYAVGIPLLAGAAGPDLGARDYAGLVGGAVLAAVLCAVLGVAIGTLIRNQVGAVVGLLVWIFVGEPLLSVINDSLTDYTIGTGAGVLGQGGNADGTMLHAALVLVAWTTVLGLGAVVVDRRRDVE